MRRRTVGWGVTEGGTGDGVGDEGGIVAVGVGVGLGRVAVGVATAVAVSGSVAEGLTKATKSCSSMPRTAAARSVSPSKAARSRPLARGAR